MVGLWYLQLLKKVLTHILVVMLARVYQSEVNTSAQFLLLPDGLNEGSYLYKISPQLKNPKITLYGTGDSQMLVFLFEVEIERLPQIIKIVMVREQGWKLHDVRPRWF